MNPQSTESVDRPTRLTHSTGSYGRTDVRTDVDGGHPARTSAPFVTRTHAYGFSTKTQRDIYAAHKIAGRAS